MSNNQLSVFNFEESTPIRTVTIDNVTWFVGKDVCQALGYTNPTKAMNDHCRGITKRYPIVDNLGRRQEIRILSEADVMRLICGSKLPAAQKFERWVFEEVLPAIRKTGRYSIQQEAEKQPETPLPATQRPAFVPEAHYYGVPVISLQKLAELIGTAPRNIHNDLQTGYVGEIADGVDIFRVKSRRELYAAGIPRDFHPWANNIDLFSRSGFEKVVAFRRTLPATSSGHSTTSAAPAIVRTKPEPVRPLGLKPADKKNPVERVTISAEKMYDLIASGKDPLSAILRKLSQAGYDVREEMAEFAYLNQCFFREEMVRMELWAIMKSASNKVTNTIPRNLTMTYWFNGDRIVDQQRS